MKMRYSKEVKAKMHNKTLKKRKRKTDDFEQAVILLFFWVLGLSVFALRIFL